eukprot:2617086-Amphidinium_carterae.1
MKTPPTQLRWVGSLGTAPTVRNGTVAAFASAHALRFTVLNSLSPSSLALLHGLKDVPCHLVPHIRSRGTKKALQGKVLNLTKQYRSQGWCLPPFSDTPHQNLQKKLKALSNGTPNHLKSSQNDCFGTTVQFG